MTADNRARTSADSDGKRVYWHRELPPFDAEMMGEYVLEATSRRVRGSLSRDDELWARAHQELMENTHVRMEQEIGRLGGDYAHVSDESIDTRHEDATGEAWLHGLFTYTLYRRPESPSS